MNVNSQSQSNWSCHLLQTKSPKCETDPLEKHKIPHSEGKVFGVSKKIPLIARGDEVFACLTVAEASEQIAHEIVTWCLSQMAYYKVPGYIAFVDGLPLTPTQKVQRAELKKLALELLEKPETVNTIYIRLISDA